MTTSFRRKVSLAPLAFSLLLLAALTLPARAYQIQATADPSRVNYVEGDANRVTIRVRVQDDNGASVPNMTAVRFNTTLGTITPQANTQSGQVVAVLENTQGPGKATVEIVVGSNREVLYIEFLGPGEVGKPAVTERLRYRLKAKICYYSTKQEVFDLRDEAQFITPDFTITAGAIQFAVRSKILTAQNDITVKVGDRTFTAEKLRLDIAGGRGTLAQVDPEISYLSFTLATMQPQADDNAQLTNFQPLDPLPTSTWIISKDVTIFPDEQIQFRKPEFYLDSLDKRIMQLPYHVLDLRSSSSATTTFFNTDISLASDAGLNVDFPLYYAANASHIGSLHLRHVTKGSPFYRDQSGLQFGLEEEYLLGNDADGALYLDDLSRPTRSASWDHHHDFGKLRVDLNAAYERYSAESPYTRRANLSMSRSLGEVGMYLSTNWTAFDQDQNSYASMSASLPDIKLWKTGLTYNISPFLTWSQNHTGEIPASGYTPATPAATKSLVTKGVRMSLGIPIVKELGGVFSTNITDEVSHDSNDTLTNYFDSSIRFTRPLFASFSTSLGYSFGYASSNKDTISTKPSQRLNLDLSGNGNYWGLYSYASYSLDSKSVYGSTTFTYYLPWNKSSTGDRRWYFEYGASVSSTDSVTFTADHLFTLGRPIGSYTLLIHYSPTGNNAVTGFGSGTGKEWAFELVRQGW